MSAIELVQDVRVGLREVGLAAEKEGARLAGDGQYAEAAEKYREGEEARDAYDRMGDNSVLNSLVAQYPSLGAMPPEPQEVGIAPSFVLGDAAPARGYNGALPIVDVQRALILIATHPESDVLRTYNHQTHTLLSDAADLGSGIVAIPRWVVSVLQEVGVVGKWNRIIGHHARVYASVCHRRACELLAGDVTPISARCDLVFAELRAIHDQRVAAEVAKKDERNKAARSRRAAMKAKASASASAS